MKFLWRRCVYFRLNLSEVPLLVPRVILDTLRRLGRLGSFRKHGVTRLASAVVALMKQIQDGAGFAAWVLALARPVWILTCWQYTAVTRVCRDLN